MLNFLKHKPKTQFTITSAASSWLKPGDHVKLSGFKNKKLDGTWVITGLSSNVLTAEKPWYYRLGTVVCNFFKRIYAFLRREAKQAS